MKIGLYDPYLDDLGGGERYMLTLAACLSKSHDIDFFWNNKEDIDKITQRFSIDTSKIKIVKNIFSKEYGFIKRLIESKKYDFIIVLSDGSIPFVLSKKLLLHIQQPLPGKNKSLKDFLKIKKVWKVFCNSNYTNSYLNTALKKKSFVIYPPIELKAKNKKKENIILSVGRFRIKNNGATDFKKQTFLVETFSQMYKAGLNDWKLVLAASVREGELEDFNKLKERSKGIPIDFLINKNNMDLWDIYSKAKIYWHASGYGDDLEKHPDYAEHFGISTVEAMGGGSVPVVINAGGQKEIVENELNGFLWDNVDELKEKTLTLIKDPNLLKKMEKEAVIRAKNFASKDFCKEVENLVLND